MKTYVPPALLAAVFALVFAIWTATPSSTTFAQDDGCEPLVTVDQPQPNAMLVDGGTLSGWAVDRLAASGADTGVEEVLLYLDEGTEDGTLIGQTTPMARPDVDAVFGLADAEAGWTLAVDLSVASPGTHILSAYARTACGWASASVPVLVGAAAATITVETPGGGQPIEPGQELVVTGWAADPSGDGTGVDIVRLYADGRPGEGGVMLGTANYGRTRHDVVNLTGVYGWANSGFDFNWNVAGLNPGPHTLYVGARSTATGQWSYRTVDFVVGGTPAGAPRSPAVPASRSVGTSVGPASYTACVAGYTLVNGVCVFTGGETQVGCAPGYVFQNGLCVYTGPVYTGSTEICPPGYANTGTQCSYAGPTNSCATGYVFQDGGCYLSNATSCPSGYFFSGGRCTTNRGNSTGPCPAGYVLQSGACIMTGNCGDDFAYVNGQCTYTGGPTGTCPAGYVNNSGSCLPGAPTACPAGYYANGAQCVYGGSSYTQSCPQGYVNQNGSCTYAGSTTCGAGTAYVNGQCVYTGSTGTQCPPGYVYQSNGCRFAGNCSYIYNPYSPIC